MNAILLIIIVAAITYILKAAFKQTYMIGGKITKLILSGYIVLLLIGTVIAYVIQPIQVHHEGASETYDNFYELAHQGKLREAEGVYETDKWSFPFSEERLVVGYSGNSPLHVEKKSEDDGLVEVFRYSTKYMVDDYDYSELINAPKIQLDGAVVNIYDGARLELKLASFYKEFTITQFTGESMFNDRNHFQGVNSLLIKVPKSVNVESSGKLHLQFVE